MTPLEQPAEAPHLAPLPPQLAPRLLRVRLDLQLFRVVDVAPLRLQRRLLCRRDLLRFAPRLPRTVPLCLCTCPVRGSVFGVVVVSLRRRGWWLVIVTPEACGHLTEIHTTLRDSQRWRLQHN